jgi:Predicted integral membrane protein
LLLGTIFALVDEIYQSTTLGRFSSSFDVIADFIGLTLSILSNKIFTNKLS